MPSLRALSLCGVALAVLYVPLALAFPLVPLHATPLLDLGQLTERRPEAAFALGSGAALAFALYILALRLARRVAYARGALAVALAGAALQAGVLLWAYPVGAVDVYDYIFRARILVTYGLNPLTTTPAYLSGDVWYPFVAWDVYPSPYGPAWALVSAAAYLAGGGSLLANLLVFKLLAVSCLIVTALLAGGAPDRRPAPADLVFVLWNPLALFETAVNAHNDTLMLLLIVAALRLHLSNRRLPAWLGAALAVHVKFAALAVLPALWVGGARRGCGELGGRLRDAATGAAVFALVSVALYAPFWQGAPTFNGILWLQGRDTSSFAAVARLAAEWLGNEALAARVHSAFALLFGAAVLVLLRRERNPVSLARGLLWCLLAIGTAWFQPWYVLWTLALAPLVPAASRAPLVAVSAGALSLYLLFGFAWTWFPAFFNWGNTLAVNACAVGLWLVVPLGITGLYQSMRQKSAYPRAYDS